MTHASPVIRTALVRRTLATAAIAIVAAVVPAGAFPLEHLDHPEVLVRQLFAKDLKCGGKDPDRYWCAMTRIGTEKLTLPETRSVFVGFFTRAYPEPDRSVVAELDRSLALAVLCLGTGSFQGKMVRIEEQDAARTKLMAPVRAAAKRALLGETKSVEVSAAVYDELQSSCTDYRTPHAEDTAVDSSLTQDQAGSALYKIGAAYGVIAVESSRTAAEVGLFSTAALRPLGR